MKVLVMAGTPTDTRMGVDVLKNEWYLNIKEVAISKDPLEQTIFQTSSNANKEKIIKEYLTKDSIDILFVYCNSLSSAVDFDKITSELGIKLVTPLHIYKNIAKNYKRILVLSANAQGLAGIEKVMLDSNKNIDIVGVTILELVEDIEKGLDKEYLSEKFKFKDLANYINILGLDSVILGCTHFPYIKDILQEHLNIPIIDPTHNMLEYIEKEYRKY